MNEPPTRRFRLRPLSQATPRQTRYLVPGLLPLRFLTLVAGIGGLGKSTWLLAIGLRGRSPRSHGTRSTSRSRTPPTRCSCRA